VAQPQLTRSTRTPSSANATGGSASSAASSKALVAVARTIPVIVWHLLADRKTRNHVRQLEALGFTVGLQPAA
jgi:hypothetical protein